jgi:hypothetical protein
MNPVSHNHQSCLQRPVDLRASVPSGVSIGVSDVLGDIQLLARVNDIRIGSDRGHVRVVDLVDIAGSGAPVEALRDRAQAVTRLNGIAGRSGLQVGANVHQ